MNGAELLAACLKNEGVEAVFGLPGEEAGAMIGALEKAGIRFVPCHDQSAAATMAATWEPTPSQNHLSATRFLAACGTGRMAGEGSGRVGCLSSGRP